MFVVAVLFVFVVTLGVSTYKFMSLGMPRNIYLIPQTVNIMSLNV